MKRVLISLLAATIMVVCAAGFASALTITNGGFEDGLNGWGINEINGGSVSIVSSATSYAGNEYTAIEGDYFAKLTSTSSINQIGLEWQAGDVISFYWAFLAFDYMDYNDYAVFTLSPNSGGPDAFTVTLSDVASVGDYGETGWTPFTYTFAAAGEGSILFAADDVLDELLKSELLIDMVTNTPVPEPGTLLLLGGGLVGLAYLRKRKKA